MAIETTALGRPNAALLALDPGASEGWIALAVSDTGHGVAPEIRDRLFDPYVTTKAQGQGGGLGLAMVFGFVKQSGGHIAVESEPGAGATFTIYLPQAPDVVETDDAPTAPDPDEATSSDQEIVLLVEDNAAVRRLTRRRLERLGYRIVEAEDAAQALEALDAGEPFDLLLTDIVMPGAMDGLKLAEVARERRPDAKLLFTSGYVDPERVREAGWPGGAELLRKPNSLAELAAAVRRALDG